MARTGTIAAPPRSNPDRRSRAATGHPLSGAAFNGPVFYGPAFFGVVDGELLRLRVTSRGKAMNMHQAAWWAAAALIVLAAGALIYGFILLRAKARERRLSTRARSRHVHWSIRLERAIARSAARLRPRRGRHRSWRR